MHALQNITVLANEGQDSIREEERRGIPDLREKIETRESLTVTEGQQRSDNVTSLQEGAGREREILGIVSISGGEKVVRCQSFKD